MPPRRGMPSSEAGRVSPSAAATPAAPPTAAAAGQLQPQPQPKARSGGSRRRNTDPAPTWSQKTTTPQLGPLLQLAPPSLETSFWVRWRRALMASDLIFSCAHLVLLDTGPGNFARKACPSLRAASLALPPAVWAAQRLLGAPRYWRARPWLLLALGPLLARGNSCYALAFGEVHGPALRDRGLAAAEAAAAGRLAPLAWAGQLAGALNALVPAGGATMYALLLPVSFRLRLGLQAAEVLSVAATTTQPAARALAAFFSSLSSSSSAAAAAALADPAARMSRLLGGGPCPALVLVLLFDAWLGFLLPLGLVYLCELSAKEGHLRDLALGRAEAVAAARAAAAEGGGGGGARGPGLENAAARSAAPAARLLRLLARRGAPGGAFLRLLRFAHVMAVVAAACYLSWWLVGAAVYVALPVLAPAWLAGACPAAAA